MAEVEKVPTTRRLRAVAVPLAGAAVAASALLWWHFDALGPVRTALSFVHECGHALAAELAGGSVESMTVNRNGGGLTAWRLPTSAQGVRGLVAATGYVLPVVLGALLLRRVALRLPNRRPLLAMGVAVAGAVTAWVPAQEPVMEGAFVDASGSSTGDARYTIAFGLVFALVLFLSGAQPSERVRRIAVGVVGGVLLVGSGMELLELAGRVPTLPASDAHTLERLSGTPATTWAWAGFAGAVTVLAATLVLLGRAAPTGCARRRSPG